MSKPLDYRSLRQRGFAVTKRTPSDTLWQVVGFGISTMLTDFEATQLLGKKGDMLIRRYENPAVANAELTLIGKGYQLTESDAGNVWTVIDNDGHEQRFRAVDLPAAAEALPVLLTPEEQAEALVG